MQVDLGEAQLGLRFDRAIADVVPTLSRERIQALLASGGIGVVGAATLPRASARVATPLSLTIALPAPAPAHAEPQALPLDVVFEDEHLVVVDKPAGLVVHPAAGNPRGTLVNALLHHCAGALSGIGGVARPGIVHRIDKDTSGLLVVAKSDAAHEGLARQFADHSIDRVYHAIVAGRPVPPAGTVVAAIARSPHDRKRMAVASEGRGKHAITHYQMLEPLGDAALIECRLETGRTHQVRVHMAHIGHPLLGDPVYGRARGGHAPALRATGFMRQALHATRLGFTHPVTGAALSFDSAMPADMRELLERLRGTAR